MVLALERVEIQTQTIQFPEPDVSEPIEEPTDPVGTLKFIEAITGRKIRAQVTVNHSKIHTGQSPVYGESVNRYIYDLNEAFRDNPEFDVVAGPGYTRINNRFYHAIQLQVRPGLTDLDRAMLAGSIPPTVPLETKIVYKEQSLLAPQLASQKRVTPTNHRLLPGEDPRLRMP